MRECKEVHVPFEFKSLDIIGLVLILPRVFADERGFFLETYKRSDLRRVLIDDHFVQGNLSHSVKGVLRGLHFQKQPRAQGKLVQVLQGEIYDVVLDIRRDSPSFGRWEGVTLSEADKALLYVPPWCAHGFCALSNSALVSYQVTDEFSPEHERGILWSDPALAITWPVTGAIISDKDGSWPLFADADLDQHWNAPLPKRF